MRDELIIIPVFLGSPKYASLNQISKDCRIFHDSELVQTCVQCKISDVCNCKVTINNLLSPENAQKLSSFSKIIKYKDFKVLIIDLIH